MNIRLTGGRAVIMVLVALVVVGYRWYAARASLDTGAADQLRVWLVAEYTAAGLDPHAQAVEGGDAGAAAAGAQDLLARTRIAFPSLTARGAPDDLVVRAEILVGGGPPPVGRPVRYFRMQHSLVTGWLLRRETVALAYYLRL